MHTRSFKSQRLSLALSLALSATASQIRRQSSSPDPISGSSDGAARISCFDGASSASSGSLRALAGSTNDPVDGRAGSSSMAASPYLLPGNMADSAEERDPKCPPCFNCMLPSFSCLQYGTCNEYDGQCLCPDGYGGLDCSKPLDGSLADGKDRYPREGNVTHCKDGWTGLTCNGGFKVLSWTTFMTFRPTTDDAGWSIKCVKPTMHVEHWCRPETIRLSGLPACSQALTRTSRMRAMLPSATRRDMPYRICTRCAMSPVRCSPCEALGPRLTDVHRNRPQDPRHASG